MKPRLVALLSINFLSHNNTNEPKKLMPTLGGLRSVGEAATFSTVGLEIKNICIAAVGLTLAQDRPDAGPRPTWQPC